MVIVTDFGPTVQTYLDPTHPPVFEPPAACPVCQEAGRLIGHGFYNRKVWDWDGAYTLSIKRWYCKGCRHTISLLPSFLLSYRHYVLAVIETVILARYEEGCSWRQLAQGTTPGQGLSRRTVIRWCRAFGERAEGWLGEVQRTLAQQDCESGWLDPVGEACRAPDAPRALLQAGLHLLAWAKTRWQQVRGYGLTDRQRFLWQWGHGQGLGRLI